MIRVEVTWRDATSGNGNWNLKSEAIKLANLLVIRSIGWLVFRDAQRIVLAQSHSGNNDTVVDTITIPTSIVTKVRKLR